MPPFCSKPGVSLSLQHACVQNICLLLLALLFQIGYRFVLRQCLAPKPSSFLALHFQGLSHDSRCTPAKVEVSQELYLKGNQRGKPNIRDSLIGCVFSGRPRPPKNEEELPPEKKKKKKKKKAKKKKKHRLFFPLSLFFASSDFGGEPRRSPRSRDLPACRGPCWSAAARPPASRRRSGATCCRSPGAPKLGGESGGVRTEPWEPRPAA